MIRADFGPLHDATQGRSNVIPFLRREVAGVREQARLAKSREDKQALIDRLRCVEQAVADLERELEANETDLPFHPAANVFPLLDERSSDFKALVDDIRKRGLLDPITLCDGMILDGRNRYRACRAAGIKPIIMEFRDANAISPLAFVLSKNLYRRHLTEGQRALFALDLVTTKHGGDRKVNIKPPIGGLVGDHAVSRPAAAELCGLSLRSVERAAFVRDHAAPEVVAKVEAGRMTLGRAAMLAKETVEEQRAAPDVKFDRPRRPKPPKPPTADLAQALVRLNDDDLLEAFDDLIAPRLDRALRPHGKQVIIVTLAEDQRSNRR